MTKPNYKVFEKLLEKDGVKAADVCRATGINSATFSNWKKGAYAPKHDKLGLIAEYFGIAPWVFYDEPENIDTYKRKNQSGIYDVDAGPGHYNSDQPSEYMDDAMPDSSYCRVHGDSMLPTLHDGDIVVVRHQQETAPNDYTVVKLNGDECTVKFVEIVDNGVWLRAENKEVFEDRFYTVQEVLSLPITIIGKAVEVRRQL